MMKAIVSNKITIQNPTKGIVKWCKENLTIANPDYYKKQQMGKWTGNTPEFIYLYEKDGDCLYLPFGVWNEKFYNVLANAGCQFSHEFRGIKPIKYCSDISLYPYQEKAVNEAIRAKNGVIVMPCGAGKTQTALELISRIGGKTLWLTHTQDLLNQSMNRAKSVLSIPQSTYGTITGGKVNIGTGITFATVQTMAKIDLADLKNSFDVIAVDECHKAVGSPTRVMQFYKVLSSLSCRYKFGLTATPKRADGLQKSMFALLGGIIHEVPKEEVKNTTCDVNVRLIPTGYMPNYDVVLAGDGTINYASLVDDLTHNDDRFELVLNNIKDLKCAIVLANRVEYLERLEKEYPGKSICLSSLGNSKTAKQIRKNALNSLNNGELDCIFATYQLAKEGLDVPNLRYVVFATPEKDETTVVQSAGRVGRKADDKPYGTVIDFTDTFGMFKGWTKKRQGYYKKLEYNILT